MNRTPRQSHASPAGFTLIELLVVISIIALLMAILLPVLGAARRDAQLIQSLSNLRQIGTATTAYQVDNKGNIPINSVKQRNGRNNIYAGWATWSFGGKFADKHWASYSAGRFDLAPDARPLNDYLYPGKLHPPVTGMANEDGPARPRNESERTDLELEVFKSPRDVATLQRQPFGQATPGVSCYDDIGTSYHYNYKWYYQITNELGQSQQKAFDRARENWRRQTGFDTTRFVLYHDQVADAISGQYRNTLDIVDSDYGMENFSGMVFYDAHASFEEVLPGQDYGEFYDFKFEKP